VNETLSSKALPAGASMPNAERVAVSGLPVTGSPDLCWKIRTARRVAGPTKPVTCRLMPSLSVRADCSERMVSESAGHGSLVANPPDDITPNGRWTKRLASPKRGRAPEKRRPRTSPSSSFD
jgi:hypothetical protein